MKNKTSIDDYIASYKPLTRETVNEIKKREEEERYKQVFAGTQYEDFINNYVPYGKEQRTTSTQTQAPWENTVIPERETTGNRVLDMMNAQKKNEEARKERLNKENEEIISRINAENEIAKNTQLRQNASLDELLRRASTPSVSSTPPTVPQMPVSTPTTRQSAGTTANNTQDTLDRVWSQVSGRSAFGDPTGDLAERGKTVSQTGIRWLDKAIDAINYSAQRGNNEINSFLDNLNTLDFGLTSAAKASGEALRAGASTNESGLKTPNLLPNRVSGRPTMQTSTNESGNIKSQDEIRETKGAGDVVGKGQEAYTNVLEQAAKDNTSGKRLAETEKKYSAVSSNPIVHALGDLDAAITGQLPYVAVNAIPGIGQVLSPTLRGMVNNVSAYADARQEGANKTQARSYAGRESINQSLGEILIGGIAGKGQGVLGKVLANTPAGRNLAKAYGTFITSPAAKTFIKTVGTVLGEGVEESLQELITNHNKRATYDPNARVSGKQVLYSGILGGLTAGFFNIGDIPANYQAYKSDFDTVNSFSKAAAAVTTQEEANFLKQQLTTMMGEMTKNLGMFPVTVGETDFDTRARYEYIYNGLKSIYDTLDTDSQAIIDGNLYFNDAVNNAQNTPMSDMVSAAADVVETVAQNVDPGEDVIRATVDKIHDAIQDIDATESDIQNMTEEEFQEWWYNARFKNVFPGISDAVRTASDNLLTAGSGVETDPDIAAKYQYNEANLHLAELEKGIMNQLEARKAALQYLDSVLRNQKEAVKQEVTNNLTPDENQGSILPSGENGGIIESGNPVMQADGKSLYPDAGNTKVASDGEPRYTLTHDTYTHTKTKEKYDILKTPKNISTEEYNELKQAIRDNGGYYSKFAHGFLIPEGKFDGVQKALDALNIGIDMGKTTTETPTKTETPSVNETVPQFEVVNETPAAETITGERSDIPQFEVAGETNIVPADENTQIQNETETAVDETIRNDGQKTGTTNETERPQTTTETVKPNVEKVENGKTEVNPEREEPEETQKKETSNVYDTLRQDLFNGDKVNMGGFVFSVIQGAGEYAGGSVGKYRGNVLRSDGHIMFQTGWHKTRDGAIDALVTASKQHDLLSAPESKSLQGESVDVKQEIPAEEEKPKREPVAPTPKQKETASSDVIEPHASTERAKPTAKTLSALKRILKDSRTDRNLPNGYFELDGWNAISDTNRCVLTDYDVSSIPQNTRTKDLSQSIRNIINRFKQNKDVSTAIDTPSADVLKSFKQAYEKSRIFFPLTDKMWFNPDYLKDIAEAFPDAKYYVPENPFVGLYFEAEHGKGIVMPIRVADYGAHVGEKNTAEKSGWTVPNHESLLKSAEAETPKSEKEPETQTKPASKPEENKKENLNNGTGLPDVNAGTGRGTEVQNQELDRESEDRNESRVSGSVQETAKERGTERTPDKDRAGRGNDRSEESGLVDGERNTGEDVRTSEPVASGESNAEPSERGHGEGNDVRVPERDNAGTGSRNTRLNKNNYVFDKEDIEYIDSEKPNIEDNLEAIRTLLKVESENRLATKEEQKTLTRFKGWGGLANVFEPWNRNYNTLKSLLTPEEFDAARKSTMNAHYTDLEVVQAIYDGLERMGLKGGNILEPSVGTGNFFGAMPKSISGKSHLYGVEMDPITARIAHAIYPDANITTAPFQDAKFKDGQFDVVVGNVPFGKTSFSYKGNKHVLHDYFFVKSLDHLKDGGIMMAITSTGTLDKANPKTRDILAKKADLIAAFRLPGGMFETNAGTKVTTDLLVFRKRPEGLEQSDETFFSIGDLDGIPVNEYYVRHPENILGTLTREKGMSMSERTQAVPFEDADYNDVLAKAMKRLPAKIIGTDMTAGEVKIENDSKKSGFVEQDGKIYFRDKEDNTVDTLSGKEAEMAKAYMKVRDAFYGLVNLSSDPATPKSKIDQSRKTLNTVYDSFVDKYGPLSKGGRSGSKKTLSVDSDYWVVSSIEQQGDNPGEFKKAPIFSTNTFVRPPVAHVNSAVDALASSISERGKVDLDYMEKITDIPRDKLLEDLSDRIVETPDGEYLLAELYLSGDVREKLEEARQAAKKDKRFEKNVSMLEAVLPKDVPAENIAVNIGASWIPPETYVEFAKRVLGASSNTSIKYDKTTGKWIIDTGWFPFSPKYGSNVQKLLENTMNQKMMQVRDRETGKIDKKETEEIQQQQRQLRDEFAAWIFSAKDRKKALEDLFNSKFNSWRGADYTELGNTFKFEGVNPAIDLHDYQRRAIARGVFGGNVLFAHGVGTGKTFEMIATAMECNRLGITHKNLFVVPNNKVADFQSDIVKLYPNARVMRVNSSDFEAKNRAKMIATLASNDYDIAVIGHTQFRFIPVSPETERAAIQEQIDEARSVLDAETDQNGRRAKTRSVKQIEKIIDGLEAKLKELQVKKRDDTIPFEKLGIDGLFVDEAHNFKNLPFYTSMNIAGVRGGTSQRASDMFMKANYLRNKGGKIVFATATPISNSMSEIYNMTRFVHPETFKNVGIESFDSWASNFGEVVSALEVSPDGIHFRTKDRFAKFRNANQMIGMFRQFADVLKTADVVKELPETERINVVSPENPQTKAYVLDIADRMDRMHGQATAQDNMLLISNDGRAAATDLRLVSKQIESDPSELDLPGSKINMAVDNVVKEYNDSKKNKGTQLIFLNQGLSNDPNARYGYDLYSDIIQKLIDKGIKPEEIARIDKVNGKDLETLFRKIRAGEVRVLLGSTMRMGEGLNIQDRIVAMHELMPTHKPAELEQSEGRAIRRGNMNKKVRIYRYIQEGSFDSFMWQQLERKQKMINVAMSGGYVDEIDDVDEAALSYSEGKALATGNPLLLEKAELDSKFNDLSAANRLYMTQVYSAQEVVAKQPAHIKELEQTYNNRKADYDTVQSNPFEDGKISITIEGTEYTDRKSANQAIQKAFDNTKYAIGREHTIGSTRGLNVMFKQVANDYTLSLRGKEYYNIYNVDYHGDNATKIVNMLNRILDPNSEYGYKTAERWIEQAQRTLDEAESVLKNPFPRQKEYDEVSKRLQEINAQLREAAGANDYEIIDAEDESLNEKFKTEDELLEEEQEAAMEATADEDSKKAVRSPKGAKYSYRSSKNLWGNGNHDKKAEVKSISDLVNDAQRIFGIPINVGRMGNVPREAQGIYKERPDTIRMRQYGDLPYIAHEIGHAFDDWYSLQSSPHIKSLIKEFKDDLTERGYTKDQIPGESVAEYFREYMEDREQAEKKFPKFTSWMYGKVGERNQRKLKDYSEETNTYFAADLERRASAQVHYRTEEGTFRANAQVVAKYLKEDPYGYVGNKARDFMRVMFDDLNDLRGMARAYDTAFLAKRANGIAAARLKYYMTDIEGNIVGPSLATILSEGQIQDKTIRREFDKYLIARRALDHFEANERGENIPTLVYGDAELNSPETLRKRIAQYEDNYPTFHEASERLYELQNQILDLAIQSGIMPTKGDMTMEDMKDRLNELYPHYVPLYRKMDDPQAKSVSKSKWMSQNTPLAKFKGSGRDIYSPTENIMINMAKYTSMSLIAKVKKNIYDFVTQNEGLGWIAEEVPASKILDRVSTDEIKKKLDAFAKDKNMMTNLSDTEKQDVVDTITELIGDTTSQWKLKTKDGKNNIMPVMIDGKVHYLEIHDEGLLKSLQNLDSNQFELLNRTIGKITRFKKLFATGINAKFGITNVSRDLQTGFVSSSTTNNPLKYGADFVKEFISSLKEDERYKYYQLQGGGYQGSFTGDFDRLRAIEKEIVGNFSNLEKIWNVVKAIFLKGLEAGENASRQAEFYRAKKAGYDNLDAFRMAQEVTVNFDRGGTAVRAANQMIPYEQAKFNALYHTIDLAVSGGRGGRGGNGGGNNTDTDNSVSRDRRNALLKGLLGSALMALLVALLGRTIAKLKGETDKDMIEAREKLSTYRKNNYWNIYIGDDKFFELKKEPMLNAPLNAIESLIDYYVLDQGDALNTLAEDLFDAILPVNPYHPINDTIGSVSGLGTIYNLARNQDFKNTPIVSDAYKYRKGGKAAQYKESTSEIWKTVGSALNQSPIQLQYAFEDMFSFWGQTIDRATSDSVSSVPDALKGIASGFGNTFVADATYSTDIINDFYDQKDKYQSYPEGDVTGEYGYYKYSKIADLYSDLNKLTKNAGDGDLSREMRGTTNTLIQAVNKSGMTEMDDAVIAVAEATNTDIKDIAPYVVYKDHVTVDGTQYNLDYKDMITYYTQANKMFENAYGQILASGYDDTTTAKILVDTRKEINKALETYWKQVLVDRANGIPTP